MLWKTSAVSKIRQTRSLGGILFSKTFIRTFSRFLLPTRIRYYYNVSRVLLSMYKCVWMVEIRWRLVFVVDLRCVGKSPKIGIPMAFQPFIDTLRTYLVPGGFGLWTIVVALTCCCCCCCCCCCVLLVMFSLAPSTDLHHTHPLPVQGSCHDAYRLTMRCYWWVVLVLRLTSPRTNRNPLTHQLTPTYLSAPSHHTRFPRWRASLHNEKCWGWPPLALSGPSR